MSRKIKVLIVDDSSVYRQLINKALEKEKNIEVIGTARDGLDAVNQIGMGLEPDLVTLDLEMPNLDGLETLKEIQKYARENKEKIGCLMVSSHTQMGSENTIKALEHGAFDFVAKPADASSDENFDKLKRQLIIKINSFSIQNQKNRQVPLPHQDKPILVNQSEHDIKIIAIGCSTGGPKALLEILPKLSKLTEQPIVIVQHMPPYFTKTLAESLDRKCDHSVLEVDKNYMIQNKHIYIAAGGTHLNIHKDDRQVMLCSPSDHPPLDGCRPSVDVLFKSVAIHYGEKALGIILTGMGTDGTKGMRSLKRAGAINIAQDEESSVVWGMPGSAIANNVVDQTLPLQGIPDYIESLFKTRSLTPCN